VIELGMKAKLYFKDGVLLECYRSEESMNPFTTKNETCPKCDTKINKKKYCGSCNAVKVKMKTERTFFPEHMHVMCNTCGYTLGVMRCADYPKELKREDN